MTGDRYKHKSTGNILIVLDISKDRKTIWLGPKLSTYGCYKVTDEELKSDYELNSSYNPSPYKRIDIK